MKERADAAAAAASWWDNTRDLAALIDQKRDEMPQPLVGVGHSMGAAQL